MITEEHELKDLPFYTAAVIDICRSNDVEMVGVLGSITRGEETAHSDFDLIVRFAKPKSLIGAIALEQQLTSALGRGVDLLTNAALSPYLRERILHDQRVLSSDQGDLPPIDASRRVYSSTSCKSGTYF